MDKKRLEETEDITKRADNIWRSITYVLMSQIIGQIKLNKLSLSYLSHKTGINTDTLKKILQNSSNSLPITEYLKILLVINRDFSFRWLAKKKMFHVHIGEEEKKNKKSKGKPQLSLVRSSYDEKW